MVGREPGGRARADGRAQLHPGIAQALWAGKLFHIDLNGQRSIKYDQDLVFGHGDLLSAFFTVDLLENGAPGGGPAYDGPRHFDYKPLAHRGHGRRLGVGRANMSTYLLLRSGPRPTAPTLRCARRCETAGVDTLAEPTLSAGETLADLLRRPRAVTDLDPDAAGGAATASSSSTSSPSNTSSALADPRRLPLVDCPAIIKRHRRRPSPCRRTDAHAALRNGRGSWPSRCGATSMGGLSRSISPPCGCQPA